VFLHPGVVVDLDQLDFVRGRVAAGAAPWTAAYDAMRRSPYADLAWQAHPRAVVECGLNSQPDNGCGDEWRDAIAAYTHALLWYLTLRPEHAEKAVEIIDAWSAVLRDHTNANAPLQAGWAAVPFVGAAELLRYTYQGWPAADVARAAQMFNDVFLPKVAGGAPRTEGNWDLTALDAAASIAVFLDDKPLFDQTVERWRARVPAYLYLSSDGPAPTNPPGGIPGNASLVTYWHGQSTFVDGLAQETCRDLQHTGWGIEAMTELAETARIQGVDLFGEIQQRLASALELHAGVALDGAPAWLCGGKVTDEFTPIPEIAYNALVRRGVALPNTQRLLAKERPQAPSHFFAWETLTHADNPY